MPDIMVLLACLSQCVEPTPLRPLGRVIEALLAMSGRVTMRGLSRWSGKGGSYRTIQRLFHASLNWCQLTWLLMRQHVLDTDEVVLMSGDHVVVTKSGQMRYGLERLFSSLSGKAGPGRCLLSLARLSVKRRTSYPVMPEPVAQPSAALGHEPSKTKARGRRGRPPGSQKRHRREGALSPSLRCIPEHSKRWLEQIGDAFKVVDFLFAGELGHHDAMQMVSQVGLHLLSQLRYHSALSCPSEGPYWGRGPRRQDGQKVAYHHLPSPY